MDLSYDLFLQDRVGEVMTPLNQHGSGPVYDTDLCPQYSWQNTGLNLNQAFTYNFEELLPKKKCHRIQPIV